MELVFQFSTDSPENACPHKDNSPLLRKEIPERYFWILVFWRSQIHFPRIPENAEFTHKLSDW